MARLGHASPRAAVIYQHAAEERDRTISDRLGEMIADEREPKVVRIDKATRGALPLRSPARCCTYVA